VAAARAAAEASGYNLDTYLAESQPTKPPAPDLVNPLSK